MLWRGNSPMACRKYVTSRSLCVKKNNFHSFGRIVGTLRQILYTQTRYLHRAEMEKPVESSIKKKLTDSLQPAVLEVINESYMHSVPKGSETHFKVVVVTDKFDQLPLIKRHRMVNEILDDELKTGVHALSVTAKTPKQWEDSGGKVGKSPPCRGGAGL